MLKQQMFVLLAQELWPPSHKFYDFIAYLKNPIPLLPQQSLLGVQVGHLPSLKKGILNDQFFVACMICVVHIGILDKAHAKELHSLGLYGPPFKISIFAVCILIFDVT